MKHYSIRIDKKDGSVQKIDGWKADIFVWSVFGLIGGGIYTIGKAVSDGVKKLSTSDK